MKIQSTLSVYLRKISMDAVMEDVRTVFERIYDAGLHITNFQ